MFIADSSEIDFNFNEFVQYVFNNLSKEKRAGFWLELTTSNELFLYKDKKKIKSLIIDGEDILMLIKLSENELQDFKNKFIEEKIIEDYEYSSDQKKLNHDFNSTRW
jgi:hypothetical protein